MRVSLFGLFLRCTSLIKPWPKLVQSVLLVIGFYIGFPVLSWLCYTCSYLLYLYTHLCSSWLATWLLPTTRLGSFIWLPWILMSRFWSLERVDSPSCWSEWRSGSVDLQQTVQSSILPGPPVCLSSFPFINSWVPFYWFPLYISLYSRNCAYQWCNIIVIFVSSGDNFVIVLMCWNV